MLVKRRKVGIVGCVWAIAVLLSFSNLLSFSPRFHASDQQHSHQPQHKHDILTNKPKILLAILSQKVLKEQRQLRHVIRRTYLEYDRLHQTSTPDRVCPLYATSDIRNNTNDCQLAYTFVLGGIFDDSHSNIEQWNIPERFTIPPSELNNHHEPDAVYVSARGDQRLPMTLLWLLHIANSTSTHSFDYLAITDATVQLFPTRFWENSIFSTPPRNNVYSGYVHNESSMLPDRFLLFSRNLLDPMVAQIQQRFAGSTQRRIIPPSPHFAEVFLTLLHPQHTSPPSSVDILPLQGVQPIPPHIESKGKPYYMLWEWDKYKDSFTRYQDEAERALVETSPAQKSLLTTSTFPRMLLGIFSMDSPKERKRRQVIRDTYLQYYLSNSNATRGDDNKHRICALSDLLDGTIRPKLPWDCQLTYIFVLGGSLSEGPLERVQVNATSPILHPNATLVTDEPKNDYIQLNIRENMKQGKTQTFLKYAVDIVDTHFYFEYIGKTDSDTLIFPDEFLHDVLAKLPPFPNNVRVYGGRSTIKASVEELHLGPSYHAGQFYWLSPDLSRYIVSSQCPRQRLAVYSEDKSM